ncbi:sulfotransferase domain-containing protein [Pseudemcibacter aquimaris]|uniref:sulfotransferase domain-containing protein n=1 Tax=Pseudemcibacter aquimaris TaxID=2857064 RepID=UPI0020122F65|nr:sulfotransferase domain-containing protein [Pseudemcibacter aquimaris]MCC3859751.1 sulfotransferase domain-containing protein [Pseudemcibacter aquimaris]WDU60145.1 sulfotransferase domain-containing protein [Pseudemcibacter aquimaris]
MDTSNPVKTREYINHPIMKSDRWEAYNHRAGDIVITTSYKAGTTWMQTIVANLIFQDGEMPHPVSFMSPWLDMDIEPLDEIIERLDAQDHRRFIKTHLPMDGIPYFDTMKYIYVCRDGRDVFMSLWNHHSGYSDDIRGLVGEKMKDMGMPPFPFDYDDIHAFYEDWISKSWFEWEDDGYPYWSHFHHLQSWWEHRRLPNIHFVHFADLLSDPEKAIRKIAAFLDIEIDEKQMPGILERISFGSMKKNFMNIMPESEGIWKGGGDRFMNKGTNGRWRGVLTENELNQYHLVVARDTTPDAAEWLEHGGDVN